MHPHGHTHSAFETISHLLPSLPASVEATVETLAHPTHAHSHAPVVPLPITPEGFAPFGNIIRAYTDEDARPATMIVQGSLKTGKSEKYNRLAHILESYPYDSGAITSIGVYRATKKVGLERGRVFDVRLMERHPYTTQAFIPMGKAEVSDETTHTRDESDYTNSSVLPVNLGERLG
jgi:allantoicase